MQAMGDANSFLETRLQANNNMLTFSNNVGTNGSGMIVWDGDDDPTVVDPTGLGAALSVTYPVPAVSSTDVTGLGGALSVTFGEEANSTDAASLGVLSSR